MNFQGIRRIEISCKLQEAAAKYQYEGFSHIYIACASTNTHKFIDMLESMFGDFNLDDLDPQQLETDAMKNLHQKAGQAEEASVSKEHGAIPKDKITCIVVRATPVRIECGIPTISIPESENVKLPSAMNPAKKITRFYYNCKHYTKSAQNKPSMMTHMRRCLNIKSICGGCGKEYDFSDATEKHINEVHNGDIEMDQ